MAVSPISDDAGGPSRGSRQVFVHQRIGQHGPSGQACRSDFRRHPRRPACPGPLQPRRLRNVGDHRHRDRRRRNHDQGGRHYPDIVRHVIRDVGYTDDQYGHLRRHLRGDGRHRQAKPGHRHGRRREPSRGQRNRGGRPGIDVRLRLQRHARVDAAADRPGPSDPQPLDRGPLRRTKSPGCGRTARAK